MYDIAIIGAGVTGAAIAREFSRYELKIILLDKESDASAGTSKANSGIIHAGFDPEENTLMAKLNAKANKMFDALCGELSVPFARNGSLVVAFDDGQLEHINKLYRRGQNNGTPGMALLSGEEILKREPAVNPEAKGALFAETAGIIDPMLFTISLAENAVMNGVEYIFGFNVESIEKENGAYRISSPKSSVNAKYVINAAGVFSDKIHNMVSEPAFTIKPSRGQYFILDKSESGIVSSTIFPCPTKFGKGILVAPTVHGNVILGPTSEHLPEKDKLGTTDENLDKAKKGAMLLVPKITTRNTIRTFSGIRAESDSTDYIIKEAAGAPNFIDVAGIKSPGLTAAPAIAEYVAALAEEKGLALQKKENFNPTVKRKLFNEMTDEEQAAAIKNNPLYGRVVCRCENITEGDILTNAIKRHLGAVTMEGVKRRCRAGTGRCQSGFCGPKVQHILARELGKPLEEIMLEKESSYILTGKTK